MARVNGAADTTDLGIMQSLGLMVNYEYQLEDYDSISTTEQGDGKDVPPLERNRKAYEQEGTIAHTGNTRKLLIG